MSEKSIKDNDIFNLNIGKQKYQLFNNNAHIYIKLERSTCKFMGTQMTSLLLKKVAEYISNHSKF